MASRAAARPRRDVGTAAARSRGPHRRPHRHVAPNLREDVAVTFVVDRALDEDYARVSRDDHAIARRVVIHGAYDIA